MSFLPKEFANFITPNTDRCSFIQSWLLERGVNSSVVVINDRKHILIQFKPTAYDPTYKIKTIIVHYDRVEGSPGANDNSAADFMIMNWAVELNKLSGWHNIRIFFTDGEELGWNTGVSEQGSYGIATTFRKLGIINDDVYVFDSCGRGEVAILSKSIFPSAVTNSNNKQTGKFIKDFKSLYERTQKLLQERCPRRWMILPVPYSDNASFLACGIPAVAITLLPADEASLYARELMVNKELESAVLNRESSKQQRLSENKPEYSYKERMPNTWRLFHTQFDNELSLTPVSFNVMKNLLEGITRARSLQTVD